MTPERYQQIDQIFQAALAQEPAKRAAFLDKACSGDEPLRKEVDSLIASDEGDLSFIDGPAFEMAASLLASDEPELTAGEHVDRYEILSLLGSGGMGEVYLAQDGRLDRKIALKLLPSDFTTNQERLRRFQQEARAASALNHPSIITIHEIGSVEERHFIATEFVDGETLRQRMKRGPLSLPESLDIAIQVCGALAAAHQAGIVHRDIKPENIMMRRDGYVKVLDFGLAKLTEQEEPATQGQDAGNVNISSGLVMGTVKYMSPEQAQGLQIDHRTDIFSLGVVLYEVLGGDAPFAGKSNRDLIESIVREEPRRLNEHSPDTPAELQRILDKTLRKNRTGRYQTAEDLLVDLKGLRRELEFGSNLEARPYEQQYLAKRYTVNKEVYDLYLKGRFYWNKKTPAGYRKSVELFSQAISLDKNYAPAYAGVSDAYVQLSWLENSTSQELMEKGKAAAMKALELDDSLAEVHTSVGYIKLMHDWDWRGAEKEFQRALALKPNYAMALNYYSYGLAYVGQSDKAISTVKAALELEPLSVTANFDLAAIYLYTRHSDEAIEQLRKVIEMDPERTVAYAFLVLAYYQEGMHDEFVEVLLRLRSPGYDPSVIASLREAYASGWNAFLKLELELAIKEGQSSYKIGALYAAVGDNDKAMERLEKSYQEHTKLMMTIKVDPRLAGLHCDPRFKELLRRVGLPQ